MILRLLDLFSGIGGFSYAADQLVGGFETVAFVEREPFCQKVLNLNWPSVPIYPDVTTFTAEPGFCDVITAGFPCQDLRSAGKQAGLSGERSGLFYEVIRLAREIQPQFIVFENVANLVSHKDGETFQEVLFQIARAGFDAEWAVVSARDVGACHLRKRVWIIAYSQSQQCDGLQLKDPGQTSESQPRDGDCSDVAHANHSGPQRLGSECELEQCGGQESPPWRGGSCLSSDWRSYLSEPVLCRGDDGLSNRVDRLKALGNAVVPQCAAIPLRRVLELSRQ